MTSKWQKMADDNASKRIGLTEALLARLRGVKLRGLASLYDGCDLDTLQILGRVNLNATSTSWPEIVGDAFSKRLIDFYRDASPVYKRLARVIECRDFRPMTMLLPSELSELKQKGEGGEIVEGTIADGGEPIQLLTFAARYGVSSTVIVDDNVGLLNERVRIGADAAVFAENKHYMNVLLSNPTLSDGVAFFHADRGNLLAPAAPDVTGLAAGIAALRNMTAPGGAKLNLSPSFLLCGPSGEADALQAVRALTPGTTPTLEVLVDALITDSTWFLFASPAARPAFVIGRLRDWEGPEIDLLLRFETDGVAWRFITRLGVAPYDPRAAVQVASA